MIGKIVGKVGDGVGTVLQAIDPRNPLGTATDRATREARRYACICSVYVDGQGKGTGFLVGADVVLTNYHVVIDEGRLCEPSRITCRFGFFDENEYGQGRLDWVALRSAPEAFATLSETAPGENTARRPSIKAEDYRAPDGTRVLYDYAILRLETRIGELPGRSATGERISPLGWLTMQPRVKLPKPQGRLWVVQHPERVGRGGGATQEVMNEARGELVKVVAGGARVRHNASTRHGSSGGAVLDEDLNLIGLHNAGFPEADGTADNRMIPIVRILDDLRARNRALHDAIAGIGPPPLRKSQQTLADGSDRSAEIDRRAAAAKIFLDRDTEHLALLKALAVNRDPPVQVNHIVCRSPGDEVLHFVRRLSYSVARVEGLEIGEIVRLHLRGRETRSGAPSPTEGPGSFLPWKEASLPWPDPGVAPATAKQDFFDGLDAHMVLPRTIITLRAYELEKRNAADEYGYMEALSEACRAYLKNKPNVHDRQIQAVVIYDFEEGGVAGSPLMKPLWQREQAPRGCGVSVQLSSKLRRQDLEPWRDMINRTWFPDTDGIELLETVKPRDELSMREVIALVNDPIAEAARRYLGLSSLWR